MSANWVFWKNAWVSREPVAPGVWKRKDGGYVVRGKIKNPRTGKIADFRRTLPNADFAEAVLARKAALEKIAVGSVASLERDRIRFREYALRLYQTSVQEGRLRSAKTRELWLSTLKVHLVPHFGDFFMSEIRRADIVEWKAKVHVRVQKGEISPYTANSWLKLLRRIINCFVAEYEVATNPTVGVPNFDQSNHVRFTEEEPNSLSPEQLRKFLRVLMAKYPQHYAMTCLGVFLGLRPSHMRPLRYKGPSPDVLWDDGILLVRQSQTGKEDPIKRPKGGKRLRLPLTPELLQVLRWHVAYLRTCPEPMKKSELLFPSRSGGYRASSLLTKPFEVVARICEIKHKITTKGMRRTARRLASTAGLHTDVSKGILGHITDQAHDLYYDADVETLRDGVRHMMSVVADEAPTSDDVGVDESEERPLH